MSDLSTTILDSFYLSRALKVANSCTIYSSPNPSVGAVIVTQNGIIGEGFTQEDGGPHAEVMAFRSVKKADEVHLSEATIYTTLEPCSIFGRTPPCCDLIIKKKVKKVVVGCIDFTPGVLGKGLERMRKAGLDVHVGILQDGAFEISKYRQAIIRRKRPYVILKQSITADGYVGVPDHQLQLTSKMANTLSHQWRSQVDAILVGANTVATDNPSLTTRLAPGRSPARVVLDPRGRTELSKQVLAKAEGKELPTFWAVDAAYAKTCETSIVVAQLKNVRVIALDSNNRIHSLLTTLLTYKVGRLLVEGGPRTISHFVEENAYDEYRQWSVDLEAGHYQHAIKAAEVPLDQVERFSVGSDTLLVAKNQFVSNC